MNRRHEHGEQNKRKASSVGLSSFTPLEFEQRTHVDTACAAYHLGRKAQTMRVWASGETGPLQPRRINGRLFWAVADIRNLLGL